MLGAPCGRCLRLAAASEQTRIRPNPRTLPARAGGTRRNQYKWNPRRTRRERFRAAACCDRPCIYGGTIGASQDHLHHYNARRDSLITVIRSFRSKETKALFFGKSGRNFQALARVALRKMKQLDAARVLSDLTIFPGNRLEALRGNRVGQRSIRINDQYRLCFVWRNGDAFEVEIVDYH